VVPVPDAIREEEVFACVVTDSRLPPTRASAEALLQQAAERISYFKLPGYVAFVPTLPTTGTQKLRYGAIIELAQALLAADADTVFDVRDTKRSLRKRGTA
jgi:acyl-coenzyme A synthetase/AMP-(fatty) acid ligase